MDCIGNWTKIDLSWKLSHDVTDVIDKTFDWFDNWFDLPRFACQMHRSGPERERILDRIWFLLVESTLKNPNSINPKDWALTEGHFGNFPITSCFSTYTGCLPFWRHFWNWLYFLIVFVLLIWLSEVGFHFVVNFINLRLCLCLRPTGGCLENSSQTDFPLRLVNSG